MKRNKKLEKYIYHYTKCRIKVYIAKWIDGGYGAFTNLKTLIIREDRINDKALIWHEMGHLADGDYNWVKNEVKAQMWTFKELKRRGYNILYEKSLNYVKSWGNTTENAIGYAKAKKYILKKIGEI